MKWLYASLEFIAVLFVAGCIIFSKKKSKGAPIEKYTARLLYVTAAAVAARGSIFLIPEKMTASLMYTVYVCLIDAAVLMLLDFTREYTVTRPLFEKEKLCFTAAMLVDCALMMINPFTGIVMEFGIRQGGFYRIINIDLPYIVHIVYVLAVFTLVMIAFFSKMNSSPVVYKIRYALPAVTLCVLIASRGLWLNFRYAFDFSLLICAAAVFEIMFFSQIYIPGALLERLLFFTLANMKDGVIFIDVDGKCIYSNKNADQYCGDELDADSMNDLIRYWLTNNIPEHALEAEWCSNRRVNGEMHSYVIDYKSIFDTNSEYLGSFFILHDTTDENRRLSVEKYRATHDSLTGIFNKEYFYETARVMIDSAPSGTYYIMCTDVKNFKIVNDVFGTETGDRLLMKLANILGSVADEHCTFGRLTADRFALCIPAELFDEERILNEFSEISAFTKHVFFKIHIHIGVYRVLDTSLRVSVMCDRANLAIKTIKDSYQNVVAYYDSTLRDSYIEEQKVISEFESALNGGQFHAYIQPQIFTNGTILGGEALVRWIHPQDGMIPPYKFIGILEQTGLISQLDSYMWEQACIRLKKWYDMGLRDNYISVNISQKDFYLLDVYKEITSLVIKYGIPPKCLHLEITETAIMDNPGAQLPLIQKLRDFGFLVEIDDFGSGYSSLNTLKDMRADILKIDMGFLSKTENKERSEFILRMIISMAKGLDMEVLTEGVETRYQVDMLTQYGCDVFQGYYFAKPMPINEFEDKYLNAYIPL